MYGHALLVFHPREVGIDPSALPTKPPSSDDGYHRTDLEKIVVAINGSPLRGFTVGNNTSHDELIRYDGTRLIARVGFMLDPRDDEMTAEHTAYAGKERSVDLNVWVSVDRTRPDRLACGSWKNEDGTVGVTVTNDPSKDDRTRMNVYVVAPTLRQAREALIATLEGTKRSEKPWIV